MLTLTFTMEMEWKKHFWLPTGSWRCLSTSTGTTSSLGRVIWTASASESECNTALYRTHFCKREFWLSQAICLWPVLNSSTTPYTLFRFTFPTPSHQFAPLNEPLLSLAHLPLFFFFPLCPPAVAKCHMTLLLSTRGVACTPFTVRRQQGCEVHLIWQECSCPTHDASTHVIAAMLHTQARPRTGRGSGFSPNLKPCTQGASQDCTCPTLWGKLLQKHEWTDGWIRSRLRIWDTPDVPQDMLHMRGWMCKRMHAWRITQRNTGKSVQKGHHPTIHMGADFIRNSQNPCLLSVDFPDEPQRQAL